MLRNKHRKLDEKGFASIVIALVLIVVLALITIGFAQLSRREQKNALDRQLANQAYYAAESGINDVAKALPIIAASPSQPDKTKCLTSAQLTTYGLDQAVDTPRGVSYSCVLIDMKPQALLYDNVSAGTERYATFSTDPTPLDTLTISWGSHDGHTTYQSSASGFNPASGAGAWGNVPGVIQVSITPLPTGGFTRADLTGRMFTAYLYPSTLAGSVAYSASPGNQGQIVPGNCHGTSGYTCSVTITGLNVPTTQAYTLTMTDYYDSSDVKIEGTSGLTPISFIGAQAMVDVTGKAQEVLKRINVHIPIHASYNLAPSIEAQDICKRFTTDPTTAAGFDTALSAVCKLDN